MTLLFPYIQVTTTVAPTFTAGWSSYATNSLMMRIAYFVFLLSSCYSNTGTRYLAMA